MYGSQLKWDNALPLTSYYYNIAPSIDDLKSPFCIVHGRDPLEGRLSNLQNYCRYIGDQPSQLAVQELWKMWKIHANLLEKNSRVDPVENKKITKASGLKIVQLVSVKDHHKGTFDPMYIFDDRVSGVLNDSTVMLTKPDGKEVQHSSYQASNTSSCFH